MKHPGNEVVAKAGLLGFEWAHTLGYMYGRREKKPEVVARNKFPDNGVFRLRGSWRDPVGTRGAAPTLYTIGDRWVVVSPGRRFTGATPEEAIANHQNNQGEPQ